MNRILLATAAFVLVASPAFATQRGGNAYSNSQSYSKSISKSTSVSRSNSVSNSNSTSNSNANNAGNNQSTSFKDRLQAPGIAAPGLTSGAATCLGSVSGGVSFPGGGILFGTTTEDKQCNLRENSAVLQRLGMRRAATELLCKNIDMNQALGVAGYRCALTPDGYTRVK